MRHSVGLPGGWAEISFGVMFANVTSSTKKLQRGSYQGSGAFPVVDQGEDYVGGYTDNEELVHRAPLPVVVFGDHTRCVKFVDRPFVQGADGVKVLAPNPYADPRYAYWALRHADIPSRGYARHYALLRQLMLPLPPAPEQQRIAEAIESYLTRLDNAVALLERVEENLKRYRASVLKAAVEGRLVPTEAELARREGRSYEPASELLKRILAERKTRWIEDAAEKARAKAGEKARKTGQPWTAKDDATTLEKERAKAAKQYKEPAAPDTTDLPNLPEGWCWTTVEQVGQPSEQSVLTGPFGTALKSTEFVAEGTPVVTIGCLTPRGIDLTKADFITTEKARELCRYSLRYGDMLFSRMATVGRAGFVDASLAALDPIFNYHLMRLRLHEPTIDPRLFLAYVRGAQAVRDYVRDINHGMTRDGINTEQLLNMPLTLPPRAEQERIVAEVERLLSLAMQASTAAAAQQARCSRLRQAILKWAFEGKLVEQDPNDEPASVLLGRIRAERAAAGAPSTRIRKKRSAE